MIQDDVSPAYSNDLDGKKGRDVQEVVSLEELDYSNEVFTQDKALARGLKQRHVQMIALVGIFGTGLFLSSGRGLALVGNVGFVVSYVIIGVLVGLNQMANAEISTLMPVTGSNVRHASHFIDESIGFALGWINVYASVLPAELAATAVIMTYWTDLNPALWLSIFGVIIVATNSYKISFYGELEFCFGILKISLVLGLFLVGLVIDLGGVPSQERLGFRYWKETPWNEYFTTGSLGRFLALVKALNSACYSFGGVSAISFFGGESINPRTSIYIAAKRIIYRTCTLYFIAVFVLSLILSSKNPKIVSPTGNAAGSPWVIAIQGAGIKVLPHIINAIVLTSAFSAANLSLVQGSRYLFALAAKKHAPAVFLKTNKRGLPYWGLIFSAAFIPLSYMSCSSSSSTVFDWFQTITSSNLLIGWMSISVNHIAMTRAMKVQGYSRDRLPFKIRFAPQAAWFSLVAFFLIFITAGFSNFLHNNWDTSSFFSSYFVLPLFIVLTLFWKFFKKTKFVTSSQVDLYTLFKDVEDNPEPPIEKVRGWKIITLLWS
ncbi:uncharacterized protein RJT20DRAFT_100808 [Scheffersomyces xylosifermentans]|uniref:uncharacterized protein n=1 Tax=Scheffersomyces xylosifermentans TaxID=1304137 RepID=UPI00315CE2AB